MVLGYSLTKKCTTVHVSADNRLKLGKCAPLGTSAPTGKIKGSRLELTAKVKIERTYPARTSCPIKHTRANSNNSACYKRWQSAPSTSRKSVSTRLCKPINTTAFWQATGLLPTYLQTTISAYLDNVVVGTNSRRCAKWFPPRQCWRPTETEVL